MSYVNEKIKHGLSALMGRPGGLDAPFSTDKPETVVPRATRKTPLPEMKWAKLDKSSVDLSKEAKKLTDAAAGFDEVFRASKGPELLELIRKETKDHTLLTADLVRAKEQLVKERLDAHLGTGAFAHKPSGGVLTKETMKEMEAKWGSAVAIDGSTIAAGSISAAKIESDVLQAWHNQSTKAEQKISIKETDGELFWKNDGQLVYLLSDGTEIPVKKAELPPSPKERLDSQIEDLTIDSNESSEAFGGW